MTLPLAVHKLSRMSLELALLHHRRFFILQLTYKLSPSAFFSLGRTLPTSYLRIALNKKANNTKTKTTLTSTFYSPN